MKVHYDLSKHKMLYFFFLVEKIPEIFGIFNKLLFFFGNVSVEFCLVRRRVTSCYLFRCRFYHTLDFVVVCAGTVRSFLVILNISEGLSLVLALVSQ